MSIVGKIKTLFSDKDKTEALFPRTKVSAVSDDDGTGLNVLLEEINNTASNLQTQINGKAPAGFGLGTAAPVISNFDEVTTCGWYTYSTSVADTVVPSGFGNGVLHVTNRSNKQIFQEITDTNGYSAQRIYVSNAWTEWEYINPPMKPGIEYRTTERYNSSPVYTKLVEFGNLPNTNYGKVSVGVASSKVVSVNGLVKSSGYTEPLPPIASETGTALLSWWFSGGEWNIRTKIDMSNYTATIIIKYTKD